MASLFGKNKLKEITSRFKVDNLEKKLKIVRSWHNDYYKGTLRQDKETSREQAYNQDFFIKILGYQEKPAAPYSFEPKATTEEGQLPDAVLSYTDQSDNIANIFAVVELKGATIDLDRPQRHHGNMSPVQQGFKYKIQYRDCPFVIVSNFWEFRLYHDNQLDYEVWTLDDLVNPADEYLNFKTFYILIHSSSLTAPRGSSKTEDLLSDIRLEQEEIGRNFYKVYREARLNLLRDLYAGNQQFKTSINAGIEKAQKIIDRIVFTCFAEDRGLLPDHTIQRVMLASDKSVFGGSLWAIFKAFFEAIDIGSEKLDIPHGYNGGLFAHDPEMNELKVGDNALRSVAELSKYNFAEDLSVTILGHIFEQSISDLEEIKNKVNKDQDIEGYQQSRRKKDGIFYTPDYIVRYIVDNSLGVYLLEQEEKIKEEFGLKGGITEKTYEKRERQAYYKYQELVQNIKIVDPACGSGAFLVYVFDYLLAENQRIASILGSNLFAAENYIRSILQNNIYGVDINEESVEITKLSLWLKTAQKGKKLTALDQNIKCGNSLIEDPQIAHDKTFIWRDEFRDIFAQGGFDVVVGNPPWVSLGGKHGQKVGDHELEYYIRRYEGNTYMPNLFEYFIKLGINILKPGGYTSMIVPDRFGMNRVFSKLRKNIWNKYTLQEVVYKWVFPHVVADTMTFVIKKQHIDTKCTLVKATPESEFVKLLDDEMDEDNFEFKSFKSARSKLLTFKIMNSGTSLDQLANVTSGFGGKSELITDQRISTKQIEVLKGQSVGRYAMKEKFFFEFSDPNLTGRTKNKQKLEAQPKILLRKTGSKIIAHYDDTGIYPEQSLYFLYAFNTNIHPLYLLAILNSKVITWLYRNNFITNADSTPQLKTADLNKFSLHVATGDVQKEIAKLAEDIIDKSEKLQTKSKRLLQLVAHEFDMDKPLSQLSKWWMLDFHGFVELSKLKLSLAQKDELLQLFEKYRAQASELDKSIRATDEEIDKLTYGLYGLTEEEICIVEERA